MTLQNDDLLLVNRGGTSFKAEYGLLKQNINEDSGISVSEDAPTDPSEGDLWYNSDDGRLYVWYVNETTGVVTDVSVRNGGSGYNTSGTDVSTDGGSGSELTIDYQAGVGGKLANPTVNQGGHAYEVNDVVFVTGSGHANSTVNITAVNAVAVGQWVDASPDGGGGGGGASVTTSENPPAGAVVGDMWWDSSDGADSNGGRLYLYYDSQWVQTSNVGGGGGGGTTYWNRSGTTLSPVNDGDVVSTTNAFTVKHPVGTSSGVASFVNYIDGSGNFAIYADGTTKVGGDAGPSPNITLNATGKAQFGKNTGSASQGRNGILAEGELGRLIILKAIGAGTGATYITCAREPGETDFVVEATGVVRATNTTIQPIISERRLKENIVAIDGDVAWETVKTTPYYAYNFIGSPIDSVCYGPMADEVPAEMVVQPMEENEAGVMVARSDDAGPVRTYDNGMLQARLYTALQTALTRIEALEAEVQLLKGGN